MREIIATATLNDVNVELHAITGDDALVTLNGRMEKVPFSALSEVEPNAETLAMWLDLTGLIGAEKARQTMQQVSPAEWVDVLNAHL